MAERMENSQLKFRTAPEVVASYIRDLIHRNEIRSGQQLQQEELAAKFGIRRIPVRDALRQLQAGGLVELYPNRGAFVLNPRMEELRGVFKLRILIETYALRVAVPNLRMRSWNFVPVYWLNWKVWRIARTGPGSIKSFMRHGMRLAARLGSGT